MEKLYKQWQYDLQKSQLGNKVQIWGKFQRYKYIILFAQRPEMKTWRPPAGWITFSPTNYNTRRQLLTRKKKLTIEG